MAGIYPKIQFEQPDWSPLGRLPAVANEAETQRLRKSLSDLNPNTVEGLSSAGGRLLQGGDIEGGMKYLAAAQALRETKRKEAESGPMSAIAAAILGRQLGLTGTPETSSGGVRSFTPPAKPAEETPTEKPAEKPAAPATDWSGPGGVIPLVPTGPGRRSEAATPEQVAFNSLGQGTIPPSGPIPPPRGGVPTLAPRQVDDPLMPKPMIPLQGPMGGLPATGEEAIARAQAGLQPPVGPSRGPQLAGPPPEQLPPVTVTPGTPPPVPPGQAVPGLPAWLQDAQEKAVPAQPVQAPPSRAVEPAAADVIKALPKLPENPTDAALRAHIGQLANAYFMSPKSAKPAIKSLLDSAIAQAKWDPTEKAWQTNEFDRAVKGLPPQSLADFKAMQTTVGERTKEAIDASQKIYEPMHDTGTQLKQIYDKMKFILNIPTFETGGGSFHIPGIGNIDLPGTETFMKGVGAYGGLRGSIINLFPDLAGVLPEAGTLNSKAALAEAFRALSNQVVIKSAGGLGRNFSDKDRDYYDVTKPGLGLTKEGNKLLVDIGLAEANRDIAIAKEVRAYRLQMEREGKTPSAAEMHDIADKYRNKSSIFFDEKGNQTELGKRLQENKARAENPQSPLQEAVKSTAGSVTSSPTAQFIKRGIVGPSGPTPADQAVNEFAGRLFGAGNYPQAGTPPPESRAALTEALKRYMPQQGHANPIPAYRRRPQTLDELP